MTKARRSGRVFALLLALLLTLQCVPVVPAFAAGAADAATKLPDDIFSNEWNQEYDVLYHETGKSYTYQGKDVTFPDENTVKAGDTAYTIKNAETTVTTKTENGKTTVSFTNLEIPVDYIPQEWSSSFAGRFSLHYQMNGTAVAATESDRLVTSITVDTPTDGTYTLTGGKLFEAANEWSEGHDFGQGVVREREFGYLPDVTIVVGNAQTQPEVPAEKPAPQITAKIGDQELAITEVDSGIYAERCQVQHTYQISVPESLKGEQLTIAGLDGYNYREVKSEQSCWGGLTKAWPGEVAVNDFGYHLKDLHDQYAADYKDLHIVFTIVPDAQPDQPSTDIPFTAKIGDQELTVAEVDSGIYTERCQVQHSYQISVPESLKGELLTITGLDGYNYREVKSEQSCWGGLTKAWPGEVAVNDFGYHLKDLHDQYAADYKDLHIVFAIVPDAQPDQPAVDAPFTARIGDQQLKIVDGGEVDCMQWGRPAKAQCYCVILPANTQATQFTYNGMGGQLAENNCEEYSNWLFDDSDKQLNILDSNGYYHIENGSTLFHITFQKEETLTPEGPEIHPTDKAPFTAKIGDQQLIIEDAGQVYCQHTDGFYTGPEGTVQGYRIVIPANTDAKLFTYNGIGGQMAVNNCEEYEEYPFDNEDEDFKILDDDGFYHFMSGSEVFHITFRHLANVGEQITASARDIQLKIEKVYGRNAYLIHIPAAVKGSTVSVNGLDGYHFEEVDAAQSGDITGTWEAQILDNGKEYKLTDASGKELFVLFDREQSASVDVRFNAQMDGAFLLPPLSKENVEAGLAGFYGYTYDKSVGKDDVTVLDALVKMHQLVFGEEDVSAYLTVTDEGFITKAFGVETSALGYLVNGNFTTTTANQTILQADDTFTFFNYQDPQYGDKVVWLEQNNEPQTQFTAAVHTPLTLTVKSADWSGNVTPVSGVQLALVDKLGNITPIKSAVTNHQGTASVTFATPGTYTLTVISGEATKVVMPVASVSVNKGMVSLSVEARTAGKGDLIPMTTLPIMQDESTVKDVLDTLAAKNDLNVEYSDDGAILRIGDLGTNAQGGGWKCFVNDKVISHAAKNQPIHSDDVIRIRYAMSATGSELEAPLYQYLQTRTEQAKEKLLDNYTESSKRDLQAAIDAAEAILADATNNSTDTNKELLVSDGIAQLNRAEAELVMGGGSTADPSIPDDFENDLWLQYDFKEMKIGDTAKIYPRRVPQIIDDPINNKVTRPNFHFDVVRGSSVTLSGNESTESVSVTAVRDGITIVKVTYDAIGEYGASSPINTAYVVFQVNSTPAALDITTSLSAIRSYDTIYYAEGDTVPHTFSVDVPGAKMVEVTCNDQVLTPNEDGTYTANLENRSNILGIQAFDADGNVKSYYHVVDARKIQITVQNMTNPGQPFKINDRAKVSFRGITMPVYKLATIYNPCFGSDASIWGSEATYVSYHNEQLGDFKGQCTQWDLATNNSFEVLLSEAGDYTFTGGNIQCYWWGDSLGSDKEREGSGSPNTNADTQHDTFSVLPDFTIKVESEISSHVPVSGITLNKNELTLHEGESFQLSANVLPANATNRNFQWKLSNTTGYFITMDETGKITAHHANHEHVPFVTVNAVTEDGKFVASCKVTVVKADVKPDHPNRPQPDATVLNGGSLNVAAPVVGQTPAQATTKDTGYTVVSTSWNPDHKTFAANTAYSVEIVLQAKDGKFAKDAAFTINGHTAEVKANNGSRVTIALAFDTMGQPTAPVAPVVPQTGDNSLTTLWCTVGAAALLGAAALIRFQNDSKKRKHTSR